MKKTISAAESAEQVRVSEELRARAARQAARNMNVEAKEESVQARVTKMGDGKVSMGIHAAPYGDAYHEHGETLTLPASVAEALEARGYVEIQA